MNEFLVLLITAGIAVAIFIFGWTLDKALTIHYEKKDLERHEKYPQFYEKEKEINEVSFESFEELKQIENEIDKLYKELTYTPKEDCAKIEVEIEELKQARKEKIKEVEIQKEEILRLRKELAEIGKSIPELQKIYSF